MNRQIKQVIDLAQKCFKDQLLGIYLYGSSVLGGRHKDSDIDLLIIIDDTLSNEQRHLLTQELLLISGKVGCKEKSPLEVTVINNHEIDPWQFPPRYEYMYGEWLRKQFEAGKVSTPHHDPDLVILLWQARKYSEVLVGDKASDIIPNISSNGLEEAIKHALPDLMGNLIGDERNVLLTLARMWYTLEVKDICPKNVAATWVMDKIPHELSPLLDRAQKAYLGECEDAYYDKEETILLAEFMKNKIESLK